MRLATAIGMFLFVGCLQVEQAPLDEEAAIACYLDGSLVCTATVALTGTCLEDARLAGKYFFEQQVKGRDILCEVDLSE